MRRITFKELLSQKTWNDYGDYIREAHGIMEKEVKKHIAEDSELTIAEKKEDNTVISRQGTSHQIKSKRALFQVGWMNLLSFRHAFHLFDYGIEF